MATARALHLVPPFDQTVAVPAGLLAAAIANAGDLADDLLAGIEAVEHRLWVGSVAGAFNELGRMALRVEAFRTAFAALDPDPSTPTRPRRVA